METGRALIQSPMPVVKIRRLRQVAAASEEREYDDTTLWALRLVEAWEKDATLVGRVARAAWLKAQGCGIEYEKVQERINAAVVGGRVDKSLFKKERTRESTEYEDELDPDEIVFSPIEGHRSLQSYSFTLSRGDVNGSFSLSFFPEESGGKSLFDEIRLLDIVEIHESGAGSKGRKSLPVFVGIVKQKKYVAQAVDGGVQRRLQVSGISAAGLVSQFFLNLDSTAQCLTGQIAEVVSFRKELTEKVAGAGATLRDVVLKVWEFFNDMAQRCGTVAIRSLINVCMVEDVFEIDGSVFHYPVGNIPVGEQTQDFYSLITGLVPNPLYERFAVTDRETGKMKVVIRQVPFRSSKEEGIGTVRWTDVFSRNIEAREVKGFDLSLSDGEVYTVFFSYLTGYPIQTDKLMRIAAAESENENPMLSYDKIKYRTYGYRPLIATFNGYDREEFKKTDGSDYGGESTRQNLEKVNANLRRWFGDLDRMYSGSITLAMTYGEDPIMLGDVVGFLGGQFYVEGIAHSWSYGGGGEVNVSVSRGGMYDEDGKFSPFEDITERTRLFEAGRT